MKSVQYDDVARGGPGRARPDQFAAVNTYTQGEMLVERLLNIVQNYS